MDRNKLNILVRKHLLYNSTTHADPPLQAMKAIRKDGPDNSEGEGGAREGTSKAFQARFTQEKHGVRRNYEGGEFTQEKYVLQTPFKEPAIELGCQEDVVITTFISRESFYAQILSLRPRFLEMMRKIPELYKSEMPFSGIIPVGASVLARYSVDGNLYRATVLSVLPNSKYMVRFVDYGNTELVNGELWLMQKELIEIPKLAVHCSLIGVAPKSKSDTVVDVASPYQIYIYQCEFQEMQREQYRVSLLKLRVTVANTLMEKQRGRSADSLLKKKRASKADSVPDSEPVSAPAKTELEQPEKKAKVDNIGEDTIKAERKAEVDTTVTTGRSADSLLADQLASKADSVLVKRARSADSLLAKQFARNTERHSSGTLKGSSSPLSKFEEDTPCAVLSSDVNWYHATFMSAVGDQVHVHFTGYVKKETVPKDSVRKLDTQFYEPCASALLVSHGLDTVHVHNDHSFILALPKLKEWTRNKELQVTLRCGPYGSIARLYLDGVDLSMKLINEELVPLVGTILEYLGNAPYELASLEALTKCGASEDESHQPNKNSEKDINGSIEIIISMCNVFINTAIQKKSFEDHIENNSDVVTSDDSIKTETPTTPDKDLYSGTLENSNECKNYLNNDTGYIRSRDQDESSVKDIESPKSEEEPVSAPAKTELEQPEKKTKVDNIEEDTIKAERKAEVDTTVTTGRSADSLLKKQRASKADSVLVKRARSAESLLADQLASKADSVLVKRARSADSLLADQLASKADSVLVKRARSADSLLAKQFARKTERHSSGTLKGSSSPLCKFEEDTPCAVLSSDVNWYHATFMSSVGDQVHVHFTGYAKKETVPKDSVRKLDTQFYEPCASTLLVSHGLDTVHVRNDHSFILALPKLKEWTRNKELQVTLRCGPYGSVARLYLDGVDLSMKLINEELVPLVGTILEYLGNAPYELASLEALTKCGASEDESHQPNKNSEKDINGSIDIIISMCNVFINKAIQIKSVEDHIENNSDVVTSDDSIKTETPTTPDKDLYSGTLENSNECKNSLNNDTGYIRSRDQDKSSVKDIESPKSEEEPVSAPAKTELEQPGKKAKVDNIGENTIKAERKAEVDTTVTTGRSADSLLKKQLASKADSVLVKRARSADSLLADQLASKADSVLVKRARSADSLLAKQFARNTERHSSGTLKGSSSPLCKFEEDTPCAVLSSDVNWYHATFMSAVGDQVHLHFTGYVKKETVSKDSVRKLDTQFYEPCASALLVSLGLDTVHVHNDHSFSLALAKLKEWTRNKELQVTLRFGPYGWLASLHLDGVDLSMKVINEELVPLVGTICEDLGNAPYELAPLEALAKCGASEDESHQPNKNSEKDINGSIDIIISMCNVFINTAIQKKSFEDHIENNSDVVTSDDSIKTETPTTPDKDLYSGTLENSNECKNSLNNDTGYIRSRDQDESSVKDIESPKSEEEPVSAPAKTELEQPEKKTKVDNIGEDTIKAERKAEVDTTVKDWKAELEKLSKSMAKIKRKIRRSSC